MKVSIYMHDQLDHRTIPKTRLKAGRNSVLSWGSGRLDGHMYKIQGI